MPTYKNVKLRKWFTGIVLTMCVLGYFVFLSAVLGKAGQDFSAFVLIAIKQLIILIGGVIVFFAVSQIPFRWWRKYSLAILIIGVLATLLVFIPGLGIESGGATRWIGVGPLSFQTSEILKFGFVVYWAAWLATFKEKTGTFKYGLLPFLVLLGIAGAVLALQPDTGTAVVIAAAGTAMFITAGAKWRHMLLIGLLGLVVIGALAFTRPYIKDRIMTYLDPNSDLLGSSYQINQSLIAIGSGGLTGRGFGQSIQKFSFLPQPIGDSIFSVAAEEFGLIGSSLIILLFVLYALWGMKIASGAPNTFGRLLGVGIVILIVSQSFINIGAMIAVFPLTGIPLVFFSQGGSALLCALFESGVIRNIASKA